MSNASDTSVANGQSTHIPPPQGNSSHPQSNDLGPNLGSPRRSEDERTLTDRRRSSTQSRRRSSRVHRMPSEIDRTKREERDARKPSEASTISNASTYLGVPRLSIPTSSTVAGKFGALLESRNDDPDSEENIKKKKMEEEEREIEQRHIEIYDRLMKWENDKAPSMWEALTSPFSTTSKETQRPNLDELSRLVRYYYPPRCNAKAIVYDIYEDDAVTTEVEVGKVIKPYFEEKPDEVKLRWIHIPFGVGIPHSSLEEIFCHWGERGKPFENAARQGFPCLELDCLHFQNKEHFQRMRDIFVVLSRDMDLTEKLNDYTFKGNGCDLLFRDMDWRSKFVKWNLDYWSLAQSDVPCQLSERAMNPNSRLQNSSSLGGPVRGLAKIGREYQDQALSAHPFFKDAMLVNSPFRAFHAGDGFLLTMSSARGVDYLDKNFAAHLDKPQACYLQNDHASVLAHIRKKFEVEGTKNWEYETAEWFTVYLMTEIASQPNNNVGGWTAPGLSRAYESIVADLKRRRYHPWKREENINLVHEYNHCIDELNVLAGIYLKKVSLFSGLVKDCRALKTKYDAEGLKPRSGEDIEHALDRAKWALKVAQGHYSEAKHLLVDLKHSLEALFQIRSIEQNERSVVADHFNKAVYAITIATVLFLPLQFVATYYGMNIKSIYHTHVTEWYFWAICGPLSLIIMVVILAHNAKTRRFFGLQKRTKDGGHSPEVSAGSTLRRADSPLKLLRRKSIGMGV